MTTPLIPQEVFLLERYSSPPYFEEMRDDWSALVKHAETCLDAFVHALPLDYRSRPLPEQPDLVWGERVLPNFRATLEGLNAAFIRLTHGDLAALSYANGVSNDFAGFARDYSSEWMDEPSVAKVITNGSEDFWRLLHRATEKASNVVFTYDASWVPGSLFDRFDARSRGALDRPTRWPLYRLTSDAKVTTDTPVPRSGIYLPDCEHSAAALLIEGQPAPPASVGFNPKTTQSLSVAATSWSLIERVADDGEGVSSASDPTKAGIRLRVEAGQPCPRGGFWFTPARAGSRRLFSYDETFPDVGGSYGATIWQWDEQQ